MLMVIQVCYTYFMSYARRNPLKDPVAALAEVIGGLAQDIKGKKKEFEYSFNSFYEEDDPSEWRLRSMLEHMGRITALEDCKGFTEELLEIIEEDAASLDELLVALIDRIKIIAVSPPIRQIKQRFNDIQRDTKADFTGITFDSVQYDDELAHPDDQFVLYYLGWTFWIYDSTLKKLLAATRSPDIFDYSIEKGLVNHRHHEWALQISEQELASILDDINSLITGRNVYGQGQAIREAAKLTGEDVTKLMWSNGSASWHISSLFYESQLVNKYVHDRYNRGFLDANIIIVPYPEVIVKMILSSLYPLPLYSYSLEGKFRKRASDKQGPIVSDRNAKIIVKSITQMLVERSHLERYGEFAGGFEWEQKSLFDGFWEKLLEAKAKQDLDAFNEAIERYTTVRLYKKDSVRLGLPASFIPQLINWFDSLRF